MSGNEGRGRAKLDGRVVAWTAAVATAAVLAGSFLPANGLLDRWSVLFAIAALAALAGGRTVRIPGLRVQATVSDLYVFGSLFLLPPAAAPIVALAGTAGAVFGPARRPLSIRTLFNLGAVPLAASAAATAFYAVAGVSGARGSAALGASLAALVFHGVNVALVAVSIRLETGRPFFGTVASIGSWSAVACLVSLLAGAGLVVAIEGVGLVGLVPGVSLAWPMTSFFEKVARLAPPMV